MAGAVEADPISRARANYPALERLTYLDVAGRGILSRAVRAALDRHLDERMLEGACDKERFFELVEGVRARFARFIGAHPDEVAITKNVSEGINAIARALEWRRGDNVVLCPALEHPNNVYPWLNLRRFGVEVRAVESEGGHMPVERMLARIDSATRAVAVSSVSFSPGFRTALEPLGRACRARGALLVVDAAQSVGVLATDVEREPIDALAVSTSKGLLGLYGMGFLYCRRAWAERLEPAYLARFGVELGRAHEAELGDPSYRLARAARRFDLGNYNYCAAAAAEVSLAELAAIGIERIERHARQLARDFAAGLLELGLPVAGGAPGPHLAHIVSVGAPGASHYAAQDERLERLYRHLAAHRVRLSIRRGMLRFSFHLYNSAQDVARVLELTREFLAADSR